MNHQAFYEKLRVFREERNKQKQALLLMDMDLDVAKEYGSIGLAAATLKVLPEYSDDVALDQWPLVYAVARCANTVEYIQAVRLCFYL